MSRYSEHLDGFLTLTNRINAYFFSSEKPTNSGGMYSYIKYPQNQLKNADKI